MVWRFGKEERPYLFLMLLKCYKDLGEGLEVRVSDERESRWSLGLSGRMWLEIRGEESPVLCFPELSPEHSFSSS